MRRNLFLVLLTIMLACFSFLTVLAENEIIINYPTFQIGVNTSAPFMAKLIEDFNQEYAGKYKIVVEEIPGDANYFEKMKVLLSSGVLPPVVYGAGYNLLDLALAQDLVLDITEQVKADPQWIGGYTEGAMLTNARDGHIYASPSEGSKVGYFYNKELFAKAGIEKPAETWDEFFANADKLIAAGITPFAMDTGDGAWITQLMMGAMIATNSQEGLDFMNTKHPDKYDIKPFIDAAAKIQMMFQKYTTLDAVGGLYENGANNFFNEKVAIIANGPWMIGDFSDPSKAPEGFDKKVAPAIYPDGFVYSYQGEGMFATKQGDPALEEAAVAMIKYFTRPEAQLLGLEMQGILPASPLVEISQTAKDKFPILAEFLELAAKATVTSDHFQANMYPNLPDVLSQEMPNLATGVITPEQFAKALTEAAAKNK